MSINDKSKKRSTLVLAFSAFGMIGGFTLLLLIRDKEFLLLFVGISIVVIIALYISLYFTLENIKKERGTQTVCTGICSEKIKDELTKYQEEVLTIKDAISFKGLIDLIRINSSAEGARLILIINSVTSNYARIELRGKGAQKSNIKLIPSSNILNCNEVIEFEHSKLRDTTEIEDICSEYKFKLKSGINYCQFEIDLSSYEKSKLRVKVIVDEMSNHIVIS